MGMAYGHPASCNWNCDIVFRLLDDQFIIPSAGFDPPFVCLKHSNLLNEKVDAPTNQATRAGFYYFTP